MLRAAGIAAVAAAALAVPVAMAAPPTVHVEPGQRTDLKVLLISADGSESGFEAWKAELTREGTPYDTLVAYTGQTKTATLTADRLADYAANHARYQAVILASGDLGHTVRNPDGTTSYLSAFTDAEWATLATFERTFGIRQLSDYTAPSPAHGLNPAVGASQDGVVGTLTATGKAVFPYLKGPVAIADDDPAVAETFGYPATPVNGQDWQTLMAGPNGTAFLGLYTHPDDGREELVMTVASNQFQSHNQLLRHGMLNWVTRGVFLGSQRNYLEVQVDDLFLGDDAWDPATHTTNYDPVAASRMTPADVDQAIAWSKAHGLRLDFAFNGGGSELYKDQTGSSSDPLATKFGQPAVNGAFGFINHTYEHPNLDCSSAAYITRQITSNLTWARAHAISVTNPVSWSRASTPAWPTRARATRAPSTRRRSTTSSPPRPVAPCPAAPTTTRSRPARAPARRPARSSAASSSARRDRPPTASAQASAPSATRSPTPSTAAPREPMRGRWSPAAPAARTTRPTMAATRSSSRSPMPSRPGRPAHRRRPTRPRSPRTPRTRTSWPA